MDGFILVNWLGWVGIYFIIQIIFLRRVPRYLSISWHTKIACSIFLLSFVTTFSLFQFLFHDSISTIVTSLLTAFLVILVVGAYLLSIYSYLESSITLRLLTLIGDTGKHGISTTKLKKHYNLSHIVIRRLDRFLVSKEIVREGIYYKKGKKILSFVFRERVYAAIKIFFPKEK